MAPKGRPTIAPQAQPITTAAAAPAGEQPVPVQQEPEYEPTMDDAFGLAAEQIQEARAAEEAPATQPAIAQEPAVGTAAQPETKAETFSKIDPATLPPELRRVYDDLQRDHAMRVAEMQTTIEQSKDMTRYRDFIARLSQDQGLREHILAYDQRGGAPQTAAPKADAFADLQPEERKVVGRVIQATMDRVRAELAPFVEQVKASLAPLHQQHDRLTAAEEERGFVTKYPEWSKYVNPSDLAEMKRQAPHMPLESLFKILAFDKATVSAGQSARSDELKKLVGRVPPASMPQTQPATRPKIVDFDDSWADAFKTVRTGRR